MKKIVMTFGTFDGIHKGHEIFLKKAKELGDELIVALAPDKTVKKLKKKQPYFNYREREIFLEDSGLVNQIIPGDKKLGNYESLQKIHPHIIALGYDQTDLKENLQEWLNRKEESIKLITLQAHKPDIYKTSLLKRI